MTHTPENIDTHEGFINEEIGAEEETQTATVLDLTQRVIQDIYKKGESAPNQNQIVNKVTALKNRGLTNSTYDAKGQQPAVSRALKKLVAQQKIVKTEDNKYLPYNLETGRALVKEEIIKTVKFGVQPNFTISLSTWLIDVERASIANAKNLFERFLAPNCYNVLEFNGYLLLLVTGSKDERKKLREEIDQIRRDALKQGAKKKK